MRNWFKPIDFFWLLGGSTFIAIYHNLTTLPLWIGFLIFFAAYQYFNYGRKAPASDKDRDGSDQD